MSDASAEPTRVGFQIFDTFYPYIPPADWTNGDYLLAHQYTGLDATELLAGDKPTMLTLAIELVAMRHGEPDVSDADLIRAHKALKSDEVTPIGFKKPAEGDALPPAETESEAMPKEPSSPSETSTEISQE